MNKLDTLFTEAKAAEILELAAKYYSVEQQSYTLIELTHAGSEVQIPDRLIQKAILDLKTRKQQQLDQQRQVKHRLRMAWGFGLIITSAIALWTAATYNHLTATKLESETTQKQVDNQQQRRADLIPQLVELTNTYANHEQEIISQLIVARQGYLKADEPAEKTMAIAILNQAILDFSRYATTNQQLQSSQLFINLQYEITGTENRLVVERMRFNQAVQKYNQEIQQFPQSLVAKTFHFKRL
jgi:LemA protein